MGIGEGHDHDMPTKQLNRTRGTRFGHFSFLTFRTPLYGRPVRQYNCRTHDATTREAESYVQCPGGLYNEQNTCLTYRLADLPWRGTCQIVPSLADRTICIVLLLQQPFNKQCSASAYYCIFYFSIYMFSHDI